MNACYENLSAIYLSGRGEFDKAIIGFGKASDNIEKEQYKKYVEYNIASLYREIGEPDAAEAKFLSIDTANDNELKYRISYELGIIAFQKGYYEKAAGLFKDAILINNNDIKLIQNMELSLLLINNDNKKKEEGKEYLSPASKSRDNAAENTDKLLNIMFSGEDLFWIENTIEKPEHGKDW